MVSVSRKKDLELVTENHVAPQRENMKSSLQVRPENYKNDNNASFDSNYRGQYDEGSYNNVNKLRSERDMFEGDIQKSLRSFKNEALQTQRDTNRAMEKLN